MKKAITHHGYDFIARCRRGALAAFMVACLSFSAPCVLAQESPLSPTQFTEFLQLQDAIQQSGAGNNPQVAQGLTQMQEALSAMENLDSGLGDIMDGAAGGNADQMMSEFSNAASGLRTGADQIGSALEAMNAAGDLSPEAMQELMNALNSMQDISSNLTGQLAQVLEALQGQTPGSTSGPEQVGGNQPEAIPSNCLAAFEDEEHVKRLQDFMQSNWLLALYMMTEQLSVAMMHQASIIGSFFDAKHQLETQRILQDMEAQSHIDYHPSTQMCTIGTQTKSLAMSQYKSEVNTLAFSTALMNRNALGGDEAEAATGDMTARLKQYFEIYCDKDDSNGALENLCKPSSDPNKKPRPNVDVNYPRVIENSLTLDIDFTDTEITPAEEDVFALARNLHAHNLFAGVPTDLMDKGPDAHVSAAGWMYMNLRSLIAVRNVAQNSFAHLVGMRAEGGAEVHDFMIPIFEEMGISPEDAEKMVGENPSYFAQMEVLTKKLYQTPEFYTNLYDKPENVKRTGVALQAIGLMQDRDRFEAALRREMLISMIVEMQLRKYERDLDGTVFGLTPVARISQ